MPPLAVRLESLESLETAITASLLFRFGTASLNAAVNIVDIDAAGTIID